MEVHLYPDQAPDIRNADELTSLRAVAHDGVAPNAAIGVAGVASADGQHVFLDASWLRTHGRAAAQTDSWEHDFDAMLAYAASNGWTDTDGRIRAHVEAVE